MTKHFLTLSDLSAEALQALFHRTAVLKQARKEHRLVSTLAGRTLVLIFEKSSTRTRLSFEAAIAQLGGHAINLPIADSQLSRGESLQDTARVVSGYADAVVMRTFDDSRLAALAAHATVPVINGLTDGGHPVQLLADLFTLLERFGRIQGLKVEWVGDGASNMTKSWIEAAKLLDFELRIAAPEGYRVPGVLYMSPEAAVAGADCVTTDVWTSMGQEKETAARKVAFASYCVDQALMQKAAPHAAVLHCLPAHRGEEITGEVLDGPQSIVWDEAENRMHVQKALLETLILNHEAAAAPSLRRAG